MATATPRCANSSAVARPSPVAPPVTTTTRPCTVSARCCGVVRGSVAGVATRVVSRAAVTQGDVGIKPSNLCSKLNIGKARRNLGAVNRLLAVLVWGGISALGAAAFGVLALSRGETVNAAWLVTAAVCSYAVGYRFYSRFLATRVFGLDDRRATPAERHSNGRDFVPTNKWVLYGHHFAAIAGAGPLVGPVLAAQFGYLPGTLWLVIGVVLGGAVQDFVILFCSLRRDGKSLGPMAIEEVVPAAGAPAMLAVLFMLIILLAVRPRIVVLAVAILVILPPLRMPALTPFASLGEGPVFAGKLFPFAFITIACGAISGFHSLVASGTTPKMIARESDARLIGYGGMLMESFVGVMAMIAACTLDPGVYFAMNTTPAALAQASQVLGQAGFVVTPDVMRELAARMGETTLLACSGGAPSLAVGMAQIFAGATSALGGETLDALWYHFAIMFEALFILTTIDTGTRVGRFMLQEIVGHVWPRFAETSWYPSVIASSALVVAGWGYFLYQGVVDPLGGINSLWPLFGISNQLLAAVALCVGTTILIKMGRGRFAWVTAAPLAWLVTVTMTAGWQKVFSADPRLGFLAHAADRPRTPSPDTGRLIFNDRLNTFVALLFMVVVTVLSGTSLRERWLVLSGRKRAETHEAPCVGTA